jgi:hypothetical protein
VRVRLTISDMHGSFVGRTVDVSRGGVFAATPETRPIGSLLRVRVLAAKVESIYAVGVVVRCFSNVENEDGTGSPGMAIALTSTSETWDRFWDNENLVAGEREKKDES